jgi:hypothetical protein
MPTNQVPSASLIAAGTGWAVVRHGRARPHNGIGLDSGGGSTALILAETTACCAAVAVALA